LFEVRNINAGYGHLQVLWDVSMEVSEGEFVALLGPNGAGKTTTLRTIAGLIQARAGDVILNDVSIVGKRAHEIARMGLSLVPQELHLFPTMAVRENLLLGAYAVRDKRKIADSMSRVLDLFPVLEERQGQLAGTLSGGERKMLALGRGLMSNPSMLLVDEPSLGLAPKLSLSVFDTLRQLNNRGIAILLVEQNVNATLQLASRSYVLEHGRIVLQGPSAQLLASKHIQETYLGTSDAADWED